MNILLYGILCRLEYNMIIVYPTKYDLENYVLDLESDFQKEFGKSMRNANIEYITYAEYQTKEWDKIVLIDPKCYIEELTQRNEILREIYTKCKIVLNKD